MMKWRLVKTILIKKGPPPNNIDLSSSCFQIKLGDFGLATKESFDGERKRTLCGTPNYIAPEVLNKKGHSYEVDIWSIGCIMYTLLVGKPPFETQTLKDTYKRIRANEYHVPSRVGQSAKNLIRLLLQVLNWESSFLKTLTCKIKF
jgi:serine/threonine protein kinase